MMERIILLPMHHDLIEFLSDFVLERSETPQNLANFRIIFPGKRPGYFLRRRLHKKIKDAFIPPKIMEIDAFVQELVNEKYHLSGPVDPLNAAWMIYETVKEFTEVSFEKFYPWALNLYQLFDEFDKELIAPGNLTKFKDYMELERDYVPEKIALIWSNIDRVYENFTSKLIDENLYYGGMLYKLAHKMHLPEGETIFAGFYALTNAQLELIKKFIEQERGFVIFQGDLSGEWTILEKNLKKLGGKFKKIEAKEPPAPEIRIYSGIDKHSEIAKVKDIIQELKDGLSEEPEELAIVLPETQSLIPLIYESIGHFNMKFNIAMGYPLSRTPLIALYSLIFRAQEKRLDYYHRMDVLKVLTHPFVKNIKIANGDTTPFRIAVHTFEEFLQEKDFLTVDIHNETLFEEFFTKLRGVLDETPLFEEVAGKFKDVIKTFFLNFENVDTFRKLNDAVIESVKFLLENSTLGRYQLNFQFLRAFLDITKNLESFLFLDEKFDPASIFNIFLYRLKRARVPFEGTPVEGVQVLGSLEARSLNFKNLIYLDLNEGVIPGSPDINPILPPGMRKALGLPDYRKTEEIFRYQFKRLLYSSRNAYLLFIDNRETSKSRYIEEIIWEKEKKAGKILEDELVETKQFNIQIEQTNLASQGKTAEILDFLKKMPLSPTAIDTYMKCPLRFYYRYVIDLKDKAMKDEIEGAEIGNMVHNILFEFYLPAVNRPEIDYENEFTHERLIKLIEQKVNERYPENLGIAILLKGTLMNKLTKFLEHEKREKPRILALERTLTARYNTGDNVVTLKGRADRIEEIDGEVFITDYKTGSVGSPIKTKEFSDGEILTRSDIKERVNSFQLPIYVELYRLNTGEESYDRLNARFLKIQNLNESKVLFSGKTDKNFMMEKIREMLNILIDEILNPDVPFEADNSDSSYCGHCPFKEFCGTERPAKNW